MPITLYELSGLQDCRYSSFSWRARMALAHKGLDADYRGVRVSDKPAIAFSGQERVPILTHGAATISDSWTIAEYLEDSFAERPSLFGGAIGRGLARFVNLWVDREVVPVAAQIIACEVIECVDPEDAAHLRKGFEGTFRRTLETMRAEQATRAAELHRVLSPARALVRAQPFLSGARPAYADYILFSVLQWGRIVSRFELLKPDDHLRAWRERVLDLFGGFARAQPARGERA